ncbi:MAG: hypothetical protein GPOALKHO_000243 [Sodalis sp.]|nr:MAG: hypothetical protein GPOALKHO_000243 [Sodalis sp.]
MFSTITSASTCIKLDKIDVILMDKSDSQPNQQNGNECSKLTYRSVIFYSVLNYDYSLRFICHYLGLLFKILYLDNISHLRLYSKHTEAK